VCPNALRLAPLEHPGFHAHPVLCAADRYKAPVHAPARRQIAQIWMTNVTIDIKGTATPIGGSARVIHSFCCPVGGRPASPGKEPNKEPTQADIRRRPATPGDCQGWSSAHGATLSHAQRRPERDWVKGSPVQIQPSRLVVEFFRIYFCPRKPARGPSCCAMALLEACADGVPRRPYGACANAAEPTKAHSQRVKDH
jgi:hypothetical protein